MVETEQIVSYNKNVYSYVQVRGSVPIFWSQKGVFSSIILTRIKETCFKAFAKHFDDLIDLYRRVLIFDLLTEKKPDEAKLSDRYRECVKTYTKKNWKILSYIYCDFHQERKNAVSIDLLTIRKGRILWGI